MTTELYKKLRPTSFKQIRGQDQAVKILQDKVKKGQVPHAILLSGPSGVGKTTLARILSNKLECSESDLQEVNCASLESPIDTARAIQQRMSLAPLGGPCRVWILDEVQSFSRAGFAQQAFLKMLEDTPPTVYFFLCTTDPSKLIKTIHTRCLQIRLYLLSEGAIRECLADVILKDSLSVPPRVVDRIVESAEGSARQALMLLEGILGLKSEEDQLQGVSKGESQTQAIEICRLLMNGRSSWEDIARVLRDLEEEPERLRRMILGYASSVLLSDKGGNRNRAYLILVAFESSWYFSQKAEVVRACWEVHSAK